MAATSVSGSQLAKLLRDVPAERPYYTGLARGVRSLVLDGRLPLRVRLPAERDLAAALGVSRTTVTAAYDALRDEGYVESRQGAGSWTALPPGPAHTLHGAFPTAEEGVIDLGCAAPAAPQALAGAVAAAVTELPRHTRGTGYETPAGLGSLRETIAARYALRGLPTRPDQILVTSGAQHAFALVLQCLVTPGDSVLVEAPGYPHALDAVRRMGARLVATGVNGGWDTDLIANSLRQAAVRLAFVMPDFHNPTGRLMADAQRHSLVAAARAANSYVVTDESFAELAIDDVTMPRPLAAYDSDGRVISVGSANKLMWAGLRVGWIRTTAAMVRRLTEIRETSDLSSPVLEQVIVDALFGRVDEVKAQRRADLADRRDALITALRERLPEWEFTVPAGGLSLWVRLPSHVSTALAEAAAAHGVRIQPGPAFGADGVLEGYVRLPYVLPPAVLREAVERLARAYGRVGTVPTRGTFPTYV